MENVPCEIFMNEVEIETNLMEKKSQLANPRKCCPKR
jgi:hypothetical protein